MSNDQHGSHQAGGSDQYGSGAGGYPTSQPSGSYPTSQPSGSYPTSQPSGTYPTSQGSAAYGDPGAWSQQPPAYAQQGGQQWTPPGTNPPAYGQAPEKDDNFFKALFDFGFTRYATPTVIKVYYIIGIVLGVLYWLGLALFMMVAGAAGSSLSSGSSGGGAVAGLLVLLFGAPVFFFYVIALRVQLEFMLALVRINQDTKVIRARLEH